MRACADASSPDARCSCARPRWCRSSASSGATSPARAGRTTRGPARSAGTSSRTGSSKRSSCPSRCSRRRRRRSPATTRTSPSRRPRRSSATPALVDRIADVVDPALRARARLRASRGIILADTKFEFGLVDGELTLCDEAVHARLVPVLAGRRVGAGHATRRPSTSSTSATTPRPSNWDKDYPGPELPDDVVAGTTGATARRTSASPGSSFDDYMRAAAHRRELQ